MSTNAVRRNLEITELIQLLPLAANSDAVNHTTDLGPKLVNEKLFINIGDMGVDPDTAVAELIFEESPNSGGPWKKLDQAVLVLSNTQQVGKLFNRKERYVRVTIALTLAGDGVAPILDVLLLR